MLDPHFVILGALMNVAGTSTYVIATLRGQVRPNRVSWALWTLAPMIAFVAQLTEGVGLVALTTFASGFCPMLILISSFVGHNAYWKIGKLDWMCGGLSLLALLAWGITRTGNVAIVFSIFSDGLAAFPTLRKAFREPESESSIAFCVAACSAGIALLTIDTWTFANYGFPLYLFTMCVLLVAVIEVIHRPRPASQANVADGDVTVVALGVPAPTD